MTFIHQHLVKDWKESRESCIERFRLIVTARVDLFDPVPIAPSNDGVGGTRLIPPLAPELLQSRIHDVTYAVAIEQEGVADHADKYVQWLDNRLPTSRIAAVFGLDGTLVKQVSNFPSLEGTPSLQPLLEMLVGRYEPFTKRYESVAAVADGIIMHVFEAYYYTWGWYRNNCRVPADIIIAAKGSPPPIGYVAFLHEFGGHPSTTTTPEETAEKLEYLLGINLPRPLPCAPTFEDLACRTTSTAEKVEEDIRDALCDADFERREVMVADERTAWQFFTYLPGEGFRWEWYDDAPGSIFPLSPAPPQADNSLPEDSAEEQSLTELKAMGYPKTDHDPGNGETFPVFPEQIFYDDSHPLSGTLPDNARPENWREMESASFNPSKAQSIRPQQTTAQEWPPSDELIDSAVVVAIRSGAIGEKELATIRRTPKSQWPDTLWASLGFPAPAAKTINVRVEIASQGTFHHITRDYYTHPRDGEEFVCFEKIQVSIYDTQAAVEGQVRLLRTVTFRQADGTLGVHGKPPEPPWRGTIDEVGCSSRMERELTLAARGDTPVNLDPRGITIGDHTITWPEVTENGGLDCYYSVTAYGHGIPLDGRLTERLYHGDEMRVGPKRAILAALIDQIDYIVANSPSERYGRSPVRALDAAADNPNELIELVNAMPWERARNILGPSEFANWLEENHPASPRRPLPPPPKTPPDTDEETPEWPPDNTPLTPRGEVALNALLINLKTQGMLTDEFLPASEGEILLNQPFTEWPPELQEKMAPYGAGPAIR